MPLQPLEEQFHRLRLRYVGGLPEKCLRLAALAQGLGSGPSAATLNELHVAVHGMVGTAATFDFPEIAEQARPLAVFLRRIMERGEGFRPPEALEWLCAHLGRLAALAREIETDLSQWRPADPAVHPFGETPLERRVLVLTRDEEWAARLTREVAKRNFSVQRVSDWSEVLREVEQKAPAAAVVDLAALSGDEERPLEFSDRYRQRQTPVPVVMTSHETGFEARLRAVRLGSTHFLPHREDPLNVARLLTPWNRAAPLEPFRILLVDDDEILSRFYQLLLASAGMTTEILNRPEALLEVLPSFNPELVVLDLFMPQHNGIELAWVMRQDERFAGLPILFLSAEQNLGRRLSDRNLAHEDFLIKPVQPAAFVHAVTSRVEKSRNMRRATDHLRAALEELENMQFALNQHAIVSAADVAGRITFVNDKFCDISGYTPHELIGQSHRIVKSGYHPDSFYREMWLTIAQGRVWHGQIKNRRRDGRTYWVEATIVPFLDEHGRPTEYISIRTDITLQKQAEEKAKSMALFPQLNPAPLLRVDGEGAVLEFNPAAASILHIPPLTFPPLREHIPAMGSVDFARCIREGSRLDLETEIDDRSFHFVIVGATELGVAHLYGSDITTLRRAEALSSAIFESAVEGVLVTDDRGMLQAFNPAAEKIFGYKAEEVTGRNIAMLMPQPFAAQHDRFIHAYLQTGVSEIISKGREVEGVRREGGRIP
ncbi:MAG: PAS domain S-box protein, partial [Magnetococcales bacterium]|nr:PAS domain S-box protein [Magnetococcales bacterium]